jgi:uncharacterized damage-inducible protein DinB
MKANTAFVLLVISISFLSAFSAFAQGQTAPAMASGFKQDLIKDIEEAEKKLVMLAEAVPAEKYSWRPGDGVRSISEVYMHVAGGNYLLPSFAGYTPPPGISRDMEKTITEKDKVIDALKQSFVHLHQAVEKTSDSDFDKKVKFFGEEGTVRYVFLVAASHCHEHLGQSIAYARTNGIVPPWSKE